MSVAADAEANRKAALQQLKFRKTNKLQSNGQPSSHSTPPAATAHPPTLDAPPAQSRDATVQSRFFTSPSYALGNVLVPSSSPPHSDHIYRYDQPAGSHYDVANRTSHSSSNPWGPSSRPTSSDPLASSSGFINTIGASDASFSRPGSGSSRGISQVEGSADVEPPRKRPHVASPSNDPIDLFNVPSSPEVVRPGQKRKIVVEESVSSDDTLPEVRDILNGRNNRIVRGAPPRSQERAPSEVPLSEADENALKRFTMTMPLHPPARVRAAFLEAGKDVREATRLVEDSNWSPKVRMASQSSTTGRVKELEEAAKAEKAVVKERAKKSLIYANRPVLDKSLKKTTPPPSAVKTPEKTLDLTGSPASPAIGARPTKRAKKLVIEESDSEASGNEIDTKRRGKRSTEDLSDAGRALKYFNTAALEALQELTGCTPEQAAKIIELRPFSSTSDLKTKLNQGKKKAGPAGISPRLFDDCTQIFAGYGAVDSILEDCERIGAQLKAAIASWSGPSGKGKEREGSTVPSRDSSVLPLGDDVVEDGALSLRSFAPTTSKKTGPFLTKQPSLIAEGVQLKEYQLLGVNWLSLLYRKQLSCILADEMGLGKTIQVISFFAYLKEQGSKGPHLIIVPSSTLENWCREFARFAPSISVQTYYAGKEERPELRRTLTDTMRKKEDDGWEVLITTYNLAQGDDKDRKFFRRIEWETIIFDEGHVLKNFYSQRYQALLKYGAKWRLLLTGTPLQNNLQELVSLMNFILPEHFADAMGDLRAIFKTKGDTKVTLLAQERVSRAKKMMTPFVLRRRKDQVLSDLPKKTERIEWCDMTSLQKNIYRNALQRSRKTIFDVMEPETAQKTRGKARTKDKYYLENSSNVLMDLRKAASHPLLFRRRFTNDLLTSIAKTLLKEPDFRRRGALLDRVKEELEYMSDAEVQTYVARYKSTRKFLLDDTTYLDAGKVKTLLRLLEDYQAQGRRILVFSQFTQVLDILQKVLDHKKVGYRVLTGSTPVDTRQALVDEFSDDESISVFLLSTKAGGMGINLTAASVVIMFDQDFNPHNDRQAQDRAYRIGQQRDVDVVKLISKGTIEEDMLRLGETKLALDDAVAGDTEDGDSKGESKVEKEAKISLMNTLRNKLERDSDEDADVVSEGKDEKNDVGDD
ncbi:hypothetical protein NEOLEDRAFT_1175297 [Neolentinus lepideus HHB14362 ss-1]|uniref:DNA helicase n=1 Tax=Neolentinus lepideus HHB14362 ss-1 TaxID=1314782 RepID=A0A165V070_9AGAM|nr:hypothetical protein NEOLEDRAFT_1175297 [Neolentinus lepideus HHB14362 ss-1]